MTDNFAKTHNTLFFEKKYGKMLKTIKNGYGDKIRKGTIVHIRKMYGGFEVTTKRTHYVDGRLMTSITRVDPKDIELLY